jgi:hypothetical protein
MGDYRGRVLLLSGHVGDWGWHLLCDETAEREGVNSIEIVAWLYAVAHNWILDVC